MLRNQITYPLVDYLKFFFSICIVALHTGFSPNNYFVGIIYRTAVPFFFVASGYFIGLKLFENGINFNLVKKWIKRLFIMLMIFEPINIVLRCTRLLLTEEINVYNLFIQILKSILFYPWGALWYIQATIVAALLLYIFFKKRIDHYIIPTGIILYIFALLCNNYYFIIENSIFQHIIDEYMNTFVSARNGLFIGFLYVGMGMLISKNKIYINKIKNSSVNYIFILSLCFLFIEITLIKNKTYLDDRALYISHLIYIPTLFILAVKKTFIANHFSTIYRNLSTSIYLLHYFVIECINIFCITLRINPLKGYIKFL